MNQISPHAYIGEGVSLGKNVSVGPFAVILGPCNIKDDAWIGPGAQIGAPPEISALDQNRAWDGTVQHAGVIIGERTVIREGSVIHQGSYRATTIGDDCWILNRSYIAHDVILGDETTVSGGVSVGGHCVIGNNVNLGMNASVHQRRVIAAGAMIGMNTPVTADVPPFAKVFGSPARVKGVNEVGLRRAGFTEDLAVALHNHYSARGCALTIDDSALSELAPYITHWLNAEPAQPMKVDFH